MAKGGGDVCGFLIVSTVQSLWCMQIEAVREGIQTPLDPSLHECTEVTGVTLSHYSHFQAIIP